MRRLAIGVTTESHPLYAPFMGRMSKCIFEWSTGFNNLSTAKARELGLDEDHPTVMKAIAVRCEKDVGHVEIPRMPVECIQDPENVQLYIQTGTLVKGLLK